MKYISRMPWRLIGRLALFFALTLLFLWLLLVLSACIPNAALQENMQKSALSYREADAFSYESPGKMNTVSDNYADTILLNISYHMGKGNPFSSTINTRYHDGGETGENYGLYLSVAENAEPNTDYTRYFHGSAMFVRLFHLFTDVSGMKQLGFYLLCLLVLGTLVMLVLRQYYFVAVSLLLSLLAVQVQNLRLSLEYQSAFMVCFALCPFYLVFEKKHKHALLYLSCLSGVLVAFFDFLTTETVTVLLPLIMVVAIRAREGRFGTFKEAAREIIGCLIAWGLAYLVTFAVKWTAAAFITGSSVFETALSSVAERLGGSLSSTEDPPTSIFSSVLANLTMPFGAAQRVLHRHALGGTALVLLVIFAVWYLLRAKESQKQASLLLLALGGLVLLRFFVLNNHSYLHCFFTYRALAAPLFALLMALWLNISLPGKRKGGA